LSRALDEFELWSGRDSVCVRRIDVVDADTSDQWQARYLPVEHRIQIDATGQAHESLTHELCHALDFHEGLVDAHRAAFDPDLLAEFYPGLTRRQRRHETFAWLCQKGPEPADLLLRLSSECGDNVYQPIARRLVQELVWQDVERLPWDQPDLEIQAGEASPGWTQSDMPRNLDWHAAGTWLDYFLAVVNVDVARSLPRLIVRGRADDRWSWTSVDLGEPLATGWTDDLRFVTGSHGPVLVRISDGASWEIDPTLPSISPGPSLWATGEALTGLVAVREDTALTIPDGTISALRVLAQTGSTDLPLPDGATLGGVHFGSRGVVFGDDRFWLWTDAEALIEVDIDALSVTQRAQLPPLLSSQACARLADGTWLVQVEVDELGQGVLVAWDPDQDAWRSPVDPCSAVESGQLYPGAAHPWISSAAGIQALSLPPR
ncbi:MAG: hypothetical protein GXP62_01970, partial [Oligoflexia bacterium]|nr:hypothetical protein [Oligoflexia bacterium]